jgi:hypothetical protein
MRSPGYCIYNETNECFLSLGTRLGCDPLAFLTGWFRSDSGSLDEGYWLAPIARIKTLGILSRHDLLYLDDHQRVVAVIESFLLPRVSPRRQGAHSLLILPDHSIRASNTEVGNQLVIGSPDEMEAWLRKAHQGKSVPDERAPERLPIDALTQLRTANEAPNRRMTGRRHAGSLCARYRERGSMAANPIRDISKSGLYLITEERWPVGMRVTMRLQPMDTQEMCTTSPVLVHLKVARWGQDGLGLEFISPRHGAAKMETDGLLLN